MIPWYSLLEVAVCSALKFVPFLLLAVLPFRRQLRFPLAITNALLVVIILVQLGTELALAFSPARLGALPLLSAAICMAFCFAVVKAHFGKTLFTLLALFNVDNLVMVTAKCLEGLLFELSTPDPYRWSLSLCLVVMHLIITVPLCFYMKKKYPQILQTRVSAWNYLWCVPATFNVIWVYHLYLTGQSNPQLMVNVSSTLFLVLINAGAFLVYYTEMMLLLEKERAQKLSQQNHLLTMQKLQYDNLQERINEARQAKHDVRYHICLIREYLSSGKLRELEAYLDGYNDSLPDTQSLVHCQHQAANVLLSFFAQQAKKSNIEIDIFVQLPMTLRLPETTLSVVLGNLLENALEACSQIKEGEKKITVRGKAEMGFVFFAVSNTFDGNLRKSKDGKILSTKANGRGLGLNSVKQLVETNGGVLEVQAEDNVFRVSAMLMEQKNPSASLK